MLARRSWVLRSLALVALGWASAGTAWGEPGHGLAGSTVLLVRHAEKPDSGPGLTPAGEARARAYASYFTQFTLDGASVHIGALIATADSPKSSRPRLTLTPLSQASGMPIAQPFADDDLKGLVDDLKDGAAGRTVLIAWHHGRLPKLIEELGVDPVSVLPGGVWPGDVYNWVVAIRYGPDGQLAFARLIKEPVFSSH